MSKPRLQHFVPQFLLDRFTDTEGALRVYDKQTGRSFSTGTRAVAAESWFYDLQVEDGTISFEEALGQVEGEAAAIVDQIVSQESLASVGEFDRGQLAFFVAIQALRTQHQRANFLHITGLLTEQINRVVPDSRPEAKLPSPTPDDAKRLSIGLLLDGAREIAHMLLAKPWILAKAPLGDLYIGDHPVAMHNDRDFGVYGSIGFAVPGVEVHMPLSPHFTLFIPCKSIEAKTRKFTDDLDLLRRLDPAALEQFREKGEKALSLVRAIDQGSFIELEPENVVRENSLQVGYAGRWVFASHDDFTLVERMIQDDPRHRGGPFGTVG